MNRGSTSRIIFEGIKEFSYSFAPKKYSHTFLLRAFLDWLFEEQKLAPRQKYYADQAIRKLLQQKLIIFNDETGFNLSAKGETLLAKLELGDYQITKPERWDGKYRVIAFDIKEEKRGIRRELRNRLLALGFVRLQNSVWVFPYECQEIVSLIKANYGVVREVIYMTVETIENDQRLKEKFNLP